METSLAHARLTVAFAAACLDARLKGVLPIEHK
jgi:hypothetical protein